MKSSSVAGAHGETRSPLSPIDGLTPGDRRENVVMQDLTPDRIAGARCGWPASTRAEAPSPARRDPVLLLQAQALLDAGQASPPERAGNSRWEAGRKFRGGNGQGVERLSSASTLARRSWKRSATSIQSRLRARLTALLTSVMCEGGREPSFRTTTGRSRTAIRSALTTEVVFKPV